MVLPGHRLGKDGDNPGTISLTFLARYILSHFYVPKHLVCDHLGQYCLGTADGHVPGQTPKEGGGKEEPIWMAKA